MSRRSLVRTVRCFTFLLIYALTLPTVGNGFPVIPSNQDKKPSNQWTDNIPTISNERIDVEGVTDYDDTIRCFSQNRKNESFDLEGHLDDFVKSEQNDTNVSPGLCHTETDKNDTLEDSVKEKDSFSLNQRRHASNTSLECASSKLVHGGNTCQVGRMNNNSNNGKASWPLNNNSELASTTSVSSEGAEYNFGHRRSHEFIKRYRRNVIWQVGQFIIEKAEIHGSCRKECGNYYLSPCSCSTSCLQYNTCCPDFEEFCSDLIEDYARKRDNIIYTAAKEMRCYRDEGGVLMVSSCPGGNGEDDKYTPQQSNLLERLQMAHDNAPIMDNSNSIVYRSQHVFACHNSGGKQGLKWTPLVSVKTLRTNSQNFTMLATGIMNISDITYTMKPPSDNLYECDPRAITFCPKGYPDYEIKRLCQKGSFMYIISKEANRNYVNFKNPACLQCNLDMISNNSDLFTSRSFNWLRGMVELRAIVEIKPNQVLLTSYQSPAIQWNEMACSFDKDQCDFISCRDPSANEDEFCKTKYEFTIALTPRNDKYSVQEAKLMGEALLCYLVTTDEPSSVPLSFPLKGELINVTTQPNLHIISFEILLEFGGNSLMLAKYNTKIASFLITAYYLGQFDVASVSKANKSSKLSFTNLLLPYTIISNDHVSSQDRKQDSKAKIFHIKDYRQLQGIKSNSSETFNGSIENNCSLCLNQSRIISKDENSGENFTQNKVDEMIDKEKSFWKACDILPQDELINYHRVCIITYLSRRLYSERAAERYCRGNNLICWPKTIKFSRDSFLCDAKTLHNLRHREKGQNLRKTVLRNGDNQYHRITHSNSSDKPSQNGQSDKIVEFPRILVAYLFLKLWTL